MVPLVPKLAVMTPARVLPVPMAPIMLSPPPALTSTPGFKSSSLAVEGLQRAGGAVAAHQRGQLVGEVGINRVQDGAGPFALAHVEQGGAAGVAVFHGLLAGEPEIEVIVRQQHRGQALVVLRLVLLQPENLGRGEAGQDGVAERANGLLEPAELLGDLVALGGGGGVAPELGRADDLAVLVERHEAVLLAADADGLDLGGGRFGLAERAADGGGGGVAPGVRMLLLGAGRQVGNQVVFLRRRGEDFPVAGIHDEDLGGLRAAVNAEQECSHK